MTLAVLSSAVGQLRTFAVPCAGQSGKGAPGQAAALHVGRSALRADSPAVLGRVARRPTRYAHFVRCAQTSGGGSVHERAARAATRPALLGARQGAPQPARARLCCKSRGVRRKLLSVSARQAVPGGGDLWGDEERKTEVGARSALRGLIRPDCLSAVNEVNAASWRARLQAEYRSAVGPQGRPPHHEPLPGTACRAAPNSARSDQQPMTATGRELKSRR